MMESKRNMLDLAFFRVGSVKDTPAGALFVPATDGEAHVLAGRLNDYPVLVALDGDQPFRVGSREQASGGPGVLIEKIRFQVDNASARAIRRAADAPNGTLLLSSLGAMVVAYDENGSKAVLLGGGSGSTDIEETDVIAFEDWQVVAGQDPGVVIYRSTPRGAG